MDNSNDVEPSDYGKKGIELRYSSRVLRYVRGKSGRVETGCREIIHHHQSHRVITRFLLSTIRRNLFHSKKRVKLKKNLIQTINKNL